MESLAYYLKESVHKKIPVDNTIGGLVANVYHCVLDCFETVDAISPRNSIYNIVLDSVNSVLRPTIYFCINSAKTNRNNN